MKKVALKEILVTVQFFVATALVLTVIQAPFKCGFLAPMALVPFIIVCEPSAGRWRLVWCSYLVGVVYWLCNVYWVSFVTVPAYVLFCLYLGLYWPILALGVRYFRRRKSTLPLFLTIPILFCGAEAWQGILITGFSWRLLGHSQYANTAFIQIADIFGAMGISFIVAMVGGLIAELVIDSGHRRVFRSANLVKVLIVCGVIVGAFFYGRWRIDQREVFVRQGPLVGSVQPNVPSHIKELSEASEAILVELIERSDACFKAGAELVAWPETMVLASINKDYLSLCKPETMPKVFDRAISGHSKGKGYVLVGAHGVRFELQDSGYVLADRFNSAYLYRPDGLQDDRHYDKIHLVPFGEYIPFKKSIPFIYSIIRYLTPYEYDEIYHLTKGREYTTFEMQSQGQTYRFGVLICYEDTDAKVTRKMVLDDSGRKKADWLVNISNDGWYVRYKDGKVLPSTELSQRTAISVFRAIENRVSILRSVNTGISCIINTTGEIQDGFADGNLPALAMAREGVAGWFVGRIAVDDRVTFFSKYGKWLDFCCAVLFIVVIIFVFREMIKLRGLAK